MNGSVLVPANRTGVTPDTVMRLSCTVANQGRFQWEWTVPDSLSTPSQLLLDATRTSVIEVPQSGMSVGEYTCTASYHSDTELVFSGATTFTVEPECESHSSCVYIVYSLSRSKCDPQTCLPFIFLSCAVPCEAECQYRQHSSPAGVHPGWGGFHWRRNNVVFQWTCTWRRF